MTMPTNKEQYERLMALIQDTAGWSILLYLERPGDVSFLVSIVPELAGYEIVSASRDQHTYDIWKDGNLWMTDWRKSQVGAWLAQHTPDDETLKQHAHKWLVATFDRYGIEKR